MGGRLMLKWLMHAVAVVALALPASASAAAPRIISMNICTDQLLLALADPAQIMGLSASRAMRDNGPVRRRADIRSCRAAPRIFWY
jgi:hypothetical protein